MQAHVKNNGAGMCTICCVTTGTEQVHEKQAEIFEPSGLNTSCDEYVTLNNLLSILGDFVCV